MSFTMPGGVCSSEENSGAWAIMLAEKIQRSFYGCMITTRLTAMGQPALRPCFSSSLLFCFLIAGLVGCGRFSTRETTAPQITPPTPAQIAEFVSNAHITIPTSAQPLGWRESRIMEDALWLQVRMPAAEVTSFLENSPFKGTILKTNEQVYLHAFSDMWGTQPQQHRAGHQSLPNAQVLNMVIDDSDATNAVVYLMWHET